MGFWNWITSGKRGSAKANDGVRRAKSKSSSLIGAIIAGDEAAIEQFLGDRTDIREVTAAGQTVLHVAISNCMYSVAERLLDAGADVNAQNEYGMTPLHSLIAGFDADVASRMLVNRERYNPRLAMQLARRIVRSEADLTLCRWEDGATALMLAASVGSQDIVDLLLVAGAAVNMSSPGGPALLRAASEGNVGIVQTLLRNGAHIDSTDKSLQTALMEASANGHESVVQTLLDAGADPNHQSRSGFTALMHAANFGRSSVVKQLMAAGAKPSIRDVEGQSAVDHARRGKGAELVHLIETAICPACQARAEDGSDGFFRSFYVSFDCKCGETVEINGKRVDRLLGLSVMHSACRATAYVPPTVWCATCWQNLVANWKSLVVFDGGEAAVRVSRALQTYEQRRGGPLFHAPKDAQRLRPPLMKCPCDNCGTLHWWTPDGHEPLLSGDLDHQAPLRCSDCGRWAVLMME